MAAVGLLMQQKPSVWAKMKPLVKCNQPLMSSEGQIVPMCGNRISHFPSLCPSPPVNRLWPAHGFENKGLQSTHTHTHKHTHTVCNREWPSPVQNLPFFLHQKTSNVSLSRRTTRFSTSLKTIKIVLIGWHHIIVTLSRKHVRFNRSHQSTFTSFTKLYV